MTRLDLYQVDAFASSVFTGNPAAVIPLTTWLPDNIMQSIATENNLSETSFFVPTATGYALRWFTPAQEVDLCGHATLAAAHVLFQHLGYDKPCIEFDTRSGLLVVEKKVDSYSIDFPATMPKPVTPPPALLAGLGVPAQVVMAAFDYIVVLENEGQLRDLKPDLSQWLSLNLRGVVVTAPGDDVDFVSRCFFPKLLVNEDPVTGSAHCELAPYWSEKLQRETLQATQLSARSGKISCQMNGQRVILIGNAIDYMRGEITF